MRSDTANLPLHHGHAPRWLFERMVKLSAEIARWIVKDGHPYPVDKQTYDQSIQLLRSHLRHIRPDSDQRPSAGVLREVVQGLLNLGSERK